jgi:hypothetical protein
VKCLQANINVLAPILRYTFDPTIEWLIPEGEPPYKKNTEKYNEDAFYREIRRLYLFIKGGNDNLKAMRREVLFIDMLEALPEDDAQLLIAMKDRKLPYKNITPKLVLKAFPGLF